VCGRFVQTSAPARLAEHFEVDEVVLDGPVAPRFNVAPRTEVLTVVERRGVRRLGRMRWGLVPSWATDPSVGDRMINARAESLVDKPAFRAALERRRCIVPVDGFYEWQATGGPRKQPMFVHDRTGATLALAGLWEVWRDPEAPESAGLRTCTIVTTAANATVRPIHDRMPVMLDRSVWDEWLAGEEDPADLAALLAAAPDDLLDAYPVSTRVNRADQDDPTLIEREDPLTLFGP
jgi:putative SOS response-associated peptidase YedK